MSEAQLQTDEELEPAETGAESAPAEESKEQIPEGFIKAEDAQKDINRQHRKYRDEERARKKIEAEAESLRKELEEFKAKSVDTTIPPIPDPYDDNYEEKIKARDEAIQRVTAHNAHQSQLEAAQESKKKEAEIAEQEAIAEKVRGFDSNIVQLGVNPIEVKKAADTVVDYGVSDALQDVLLEDEEGPLLVSYLAQNPVELSELNSMSTLQMFNHLNAIRPKAQLLKPKTSQAPDPGTQIEGGGAAELEDPLLKGVKFE